MVEKVLMCQAGPFSSDEWKAYMESYKGAPFKDLKFAAGTLRNVFNQFLEERGLYIQRNGKILTYHEYRGWVSKNKKADWQYDYYLKKYNNFKPIPNNSSWTQEYILNKLIELKIILQSGAEKKDLFLDQYKFWRKSWAVDESRFVKKDNL